MQELSRLVQQSCSSFLLGFVWLCKSLEERAFRLRKLSATAAAELEQQAGSSPCFLLMPCTVPGSRPWPVSTLSQLRWSWSSHARSSAPHPPFARDSFDRRFTARSGHRPPTMPALHTVLPQDAPIPVQQSAERSVQLERLGEPSAVRQALTARALGGSHRRCFPAPHRPVRHRGCLVTTGSSRTCQNSFPSRYATNTH